MSTLAVAVLSAVVGALLGVMLGRVIDPAHQENQRQAASLQKAQQDLEDLRSQTREHFTSAAASLQQLSDSTRQLQTQLAIDALKISGLELAPASENPELEEFRLARLLGTTEENVEAPRDYAPRDYAPKGKNSPSTLSEEYGLKD